jgi:hypothetical protein
MRLLAALLIAGLFAGCGGGEKEDAATPAATESAAEAEAGVRESFVTYNAALANRDYKTACGRLAPETVTKLRANVKAAGLTDAPADCEGLLGEIYASTDQDPKQKKALDEIVNSAEVDSVKVTGDTAVINWSATVGGTKTPISQTARRIDGEWKLIDVTN